MDLKDNSIFRKFAEAYSDSPEIVEKLERNLKDPSLIKEGDKAEVLRRAKQLTDLRAGAAKKISSDPRNSLVDFMKASGGEADFDREVPEVVKGKTKLTDKYMIGKGKTEKISDNVTKLEGEPELYKKAPVSSSEAAENIRERSRIKEGFDLREASAAQNTQSKMEKLKRAARNEKRTQGRVSDATTQALKNISEQRSLDLKKARMGKSNLLKSVGKKAGKKLAGAVPFIGPAMAAYSALKSGDVAAAGDSIMEDIAPSVGKGSDVVPMSDYDYMRMREPGITEEDFQERLRKLAEMRQNSRMAKPEDKLKK